ncbi:phosphate ABC transporter permease PstA, partial [Methanohalophilus sp.]
MKYRRLKGSIFEAISYASALSTVLILIFILGKITIEGLPALSLDFILTPESEAEGLGGGIANAIIGTIMLSISSVVLASPLAIGTAIYLKRYAKEGRFVNGFRFLLDVLSGTPSIVLGIFGLLFIALYMRYITGGFSFISGMLALAILILPVIERATEEAINTVPTELEDASYALGASKWETISKITIPYALTGIVTGIVLSIGRAAEESAVVILTAGYSQFIPEFKVASEPNLIFGLKIYPFQDLIAALPITIYQAFEYPHLVSPSEGFAASFVIIVIVMFINAITRLIVWRRR